MNKTLNNVIMIAVGAAIGSAATYYFVKTKYEQMADKEIESMRQYYKRKELEKSKSTIEKVETALEEVKESADKAVEEYKNYASAYASDQLAKPDSKTEEEKKKEDMTEPYIITPEEFSDSEYATETLTYYADGVIEDDYNYIWSEDEIAETLGEDFAEHFGEYEEDSVYVRNDNNEIDYEILRDTRRYNSL